MFCTQCGLELDESARFCSRCGKSTQPGYTAASYERRLTRPYEGKRIAGVCAGLARYLGMDVTLMRILWLALLLLSGGIAGIVYICAWFLMPRDPIPLASNRCCTAEQHL